ncbi:D-alanyl-D-alanine carboxypeptidase family protein [Futiania mangrovi]|uniref:serine-type D-Ala-D-Ala carboxypeptidase n=1 Tax=Futiania mangrovi TaxID=2959716 RepID=A0A9J6PGP1_9PROT|nr:D-alanyl-D-alanine carboxypeptidase family protein [Futiania mangrovii]MCP1335767.1 D-alanyl-D-alanine carboxypeptidase [Futiania mangrovii]
MTAALRFTTLAALALLALFAGTLSARAQVAFETQAREAILIDAQTGTILFEKNADTPMPPASMSKLMTTFMVFEAIKEGRLKLEDRLPVSERAWKMGGSKMWVLVGDEIRVADLLRGVIVQSGNDACIVLAEALAGSEEAFADRMTRRAREMGFQTATFMNATGWPAEGHQMTAREVALLSRRIIEQFPGLYKIYSETSFTWAGITQENRNPLLYTDIGADGLKTGHTEEAGYGLAGTAVRDGRRLIVVVTGLPSTRDRAQESQRLLRWGFSEFDNIKLFSKGETVEVADVWAGDAATVPLVVADDITVTLPVVARDGVTVTASYVGPVQAPVAAGTRVGTLKVSVPDGDDVELPLYAGADVGKAGLMGRLKAAATYAVHSVLGN